MAFPRCVDCRTTVEDSTQSQIWTALPGLRGKRVSYYEVEDEIKTECGFFQGESGWLLDVCYLLEENATHAKCTCMRPGTFAAVRARVRIESKLHGAVIADEVTESARACSYYSVKLSRYGSL